MSKWDSETQQFHGGQEWQTLSNFIEDFSVTTNGLGIPQAALKAAREALDNCHHYPSADQEPAKSSLANFLSKSSHNDDVVLSTLHENNHQQCKSIHARLLLGNGASELIDLVTRIAPQGPWKPGPWRIQYMEYERSAKALGREILPTGSLTPAALTCIVNPNNPTGDYMHINALKSYIETSVADHSVVMVDESMQPWHSPGFRADSLLSQPEWINEIFSQRGIAVYIMHSWTKIWSCTGLRLGSLICPTIDHCTALKKIQVPWSVNVSALAFLDTVTGSLEREYLEQTWNSTTTWRAELVKRVEALMPPSCDWIITGAPFISWIWIDFKDESVAREAVDRARAAGVPVRPGLNGYNCASCVRAAVREPKLVDVLIKAWQGLGR